MFSHLVESDLHRGDLKRKGLFFLSTMAAYALVLMMTGVAGVYAYEAQIDDQQTLELVALVPPETEKPKETEEPRRPKTNTQPVQVNAGEARRNTGGLIKNTPSRDVSTDLTKTAGAAKAATTQTPPIFSTGERKLNPDDYSAFLGGPGRNKSNQPGTRDGGGGVDGDTIITEEPPPVKKRVEKPQRERIPYIGPVNGRALSLSQPAYPALARTAGIQGPVTVEIIIDEAGRVTAAHATTGHPLLRLESERAAYRARFSPTLLQSQPVKVKGVITFNFILNR